MAKEIYLSESETNSKVFLISKEYIYNGGTEKCSVVSVNPRDETPFTKICFDVRYVQNPFGFGSVLKMSEKGEWSRQYKYSEHSYDYVGVLDKRNNIIIAYGNKFKEISIDIKNMNINIERGDELLIERVCYPDHYDFNIIHNVTRAKIQYEIQKLARCKEK
ncbi:MAG: hypothetical protein IKN73_02415 [Alphaproteobacteria bacterium]|nr:hypothetical protein [Alphaproteobacteria bacterium]